METKSLRKRFNMLRFNVHEGKAREAKVHVETTVLLAKSASLDKELMTRNNLKGGKYLTCKQGADNNGSDNELIEEGDQEEIFYKPPFLIV